MLLDQDRAREAQQCLRVGEHADAMLYEIEGSEGFGLPFSRQTDLPSKRAAATEAVDLLKLLQAHTPVALNYAL